ncbi:uncharacterized protein UV8b_06319 [Ustilaginoidea virens]|uniref:25S rRNA adenine-N(1) methyltransferase n=1 Tax=Ustilaginoidea virens TaxID=1159556 RepID=A0A1B5L7N2_USTVR|nr:uncharacterized protein UV8b_06319 [Ustilaginoidea virens]QUC22078.1 hypothetical protein UV8b_06319 [Ustilaginoidea virens]GAO19683.1 hypothetical protein UVI_02022570 [Ustilaginoidea virens]
MRPTRKSLQSGRPPTARPTRRCMSREASRKLINKHHQLQKNQRRATAQGDEKTAAAITEEISSLGGLSRYQQASLQGQRNDRGGDTSRVLLEWLPLDSVNKLSHRPRMLEVGCLSTRNACSASGLFDMVHIDLNSQEPGIIQQDFMHRPLPEHASDKFDIISLSLVLNFVPSPEERGQMLLRTLSFLRHCHTPRQARSELPFPSLFLVLPRSCVDNSRYFTDERLWSIMESLGYSLERSKKTQKLAYSLWVKPPDTRVTHHAFPKTEINSGRTRNNFSITLTKVPPT